MKHDDDLDYIDEKKLGTKLAQSALDRLISLSEKTIRNKLAIYKNKTKSSYETYLINRQRRARQVKNFIYDIESIPIESIYVETLLRSNNVTVNEQEFISNICEKREVKNEYIHKHQREYISAVIRGVAGSGKSFFASRIFLELCKINASKIPILIELRDLNDIEPTDFKNILFNEFDLHGAEISIEQVEIGLQNGLFTLILDGQDEISKEYERHYSKIFRNISTKYTLCPIVITGRPSLEVLSWKDFNIYDMEQLSIEKVEELIGKLTFDKTVKINFIDKIRAGLYDTHQEYLGIPLLTIVMLLTFSDIGRISNEAHEFYEDAFNALWQKHDARKEGYVRRRYCDLGKQQFTDLLSSFAASSYVRDTFDFDEYEYLKHMNNAQRLSSIKVNTENFHTDLVKSTSICIVDGRVLRFCHRTFHEYFTALYILRQNKQDTNIAINEVSKRFETDTVLSIIRSINEEKFESDWVQPTLNYWLPHLISTKKDIEKYKRIFDSKQAYQLACIRDMYAFNPTTSELMAAIDAHSDMVEYFDDDNNTLSNNENNLKPVMSEIDNFIRLSEELKEKQSARETARNDVFGHI